jgi:hypothetical protein
MARLTRPAVVALLLALPANSHYMLNKLIVNGKQVGEQYEYIRRHTNGYQPSLSYDILNSTNLRCNEGAVPNMGTKTFEVMAGDRIGIGVTNYSGSNNWIWHPGPGFIYMSKAPNTAEAYDGSGDWFKVFEVGAIGDPKTLEGWGAYGAESLEFTLPASTPDGEYLLRAEHFAIQTNGPGDYDYPQFYFSCAQIRVVGGGTGTPAPLTKIPGAFKRDDPAFVYKWPIDEGDFVMPGPAVWTGED